MDLRSIVGIARNTQVEENVKKAAWHTPDGLFLYYSKRYKNCRLSQDFKHNFYYRLSYIMKVKSIYPLSMAMAAAMAAVSAALRGFPVFLIPRHAPDHQGHDADQHCQYNSCTHLNTS